MNLLRNIQDNKICRVEVVSVLSDQPLVLEPVEGQFSETAEVNASFNSIYFTVDSCYLEENGKPTIAGDMYVQDFGFKIPTNVDRVTFLKYFKILKMIRLIYINGYHTDICRNDFTSNIPMKATFSTEGKFTLIKWSRETIFPFTFSQ